MSSPILETIFGYLGFDPFYAVLGLLILVLIQIILLIVVLCKLKKMYRKYDRFMRGKDAESLEDLFVDALERVKALEASDEKKKEQLKEIEENLQITYQKLGLVKYDAFREMNGKLSFALALLNKDNDGYVLNSVYSREGCYSYIKEIIKGESYAALGEEEKEALERAMDRELL